MVHKKSTYKLAFKNISQEERRRIWEENLQLRQRRFMEEMSHQLIDETDSECECDYDDQTCNSQNRTQHLKNKCTQTKAPVDISCQEPCIENKNFENKICSKGILKKSKSSNGACPASSSSYNNSNNYETVIYDNSQSILKSSDEVFSKTDSRSLIDQKTKYRSELNLYSSEVEREFRGGVMRSSSARGEYDLIPATLNTLDYQKSSSTPSRTLSADCSAYNIDRRSSRPVSACRSPALRLGRRALSSYRKEPRVAGSLVPWDTCGRCGDLMQFG